MAVETDFRKILNETYLFAGIDDATLTLIADSGDVWELAKDAYLYNEGDDALDAYLLLTGMVRITLKSGSRSIISASVMRSRSVFGWAALVPDQPKRIGSAIAIEPSSVLVLHGDKLLGMLRENTDAGFLIMQRLTGMIARSFMDTQN